ncbi:unnamed protein product [Arctia plantaginis]|uniref:Uncharacterized protein n=1 Tax=Arctia plantaginis TaxID=874455 RepID=A0A8S0Z8J0_ARCPL|nr:unnamed protein product [Arctia plantaginis]
MLVISRFICSCSKCQEHSDSEQGRRAVLDEKASVEVQRGMRGMEGASGRLRLLPVITECFSPGILCRYKKPHKGRARLV